MPSAEQLFCVFSSLVTGSRSHKLVTSDVSRILWYYYNDSVRTLRMSHHRPLIWNCAADSLCDMRRKRAVLCLIISHEMGQDTHWTWTSAVIASDVARSYCHGVILGIFVEEHHQLCPALEGVKNPCRGRSRRAGEGTRGEPEVKGAMRDGLDSLMIICSLYSTFRFNY